MDKFSVNTAKSQIGFIDVVVFPTFDVLKNFIPGLKKFIINLDVNKSKWKDLIDEYEEELSRNFFV